MKLHFKTKKIATLGVLSALALALSFLDGLIAPFMPLGTKPGLSNIIVMLCAVELGLPYALTVAAVKGAFAFLTRGSVAFAMSFCGGFLSALVMAVLLRLPKQPFGLTGIGVFGAVVHNMGQLLVSRLLLGRAAWAYAPVLLLVAVPCGILSGTVFRYVLPVMQKTLKKTYISADSASIQPIERNG